jgi:hypothetical protein
MTISLSTIANSATFGSWLQRTNDICDIITRNVVTVDVTTAGSLSTGNGFVNGSFGSVTLFANDISGNVVINSSSISTSWGLDVNSSSLALSNSTLIIFTANASGLFTNNGLNINGGDLIVSGNLVVSGNLQTVGETTGNGNYIPISNSFSLGNTTNRWVVWSTDTAISGNLYIGNTTVNTVINSTSMNISNSTTSLLLTLPTSAQKSDGQYYLNANGAWVFLTSSLLYSNSYTVNSISTQTVDYYSMSSYKGAKYIVSAVDNNANNRYFAELLTTHDTNSGYITEYGMITTNSNIGTFSASANASSVLLQFTSASSTNVTIKFARTII